MSGRNTDNNESEDDTGQSSFRPIPIDPTTDEHGAEFDYGTDEPGAVGGPFVDDNDESEDDTGQSSFRSIPIDPTTDEHCAEFDYGTDQPGAVGGPFVDDNDKSEDDTGQSSFRPIPIDPTTDEHRAEFDYGTDEQGAVGGPSVDDNDESVDGTGQSSLRSILINPINHQHNAGSDHCTDEPGAVGGLQGTSHVHECGTNVRNPQSALRCNGRISGRNKSVQKSTDHCIRHRKGMEVFKNIHREDLVSDVMNPSEYKPTIAFCQEHLYFFSMESVGFSLSREPPNIFIKESDEKCNGKICTSSSAKSTISRDSAVTKKRYYGTYRNPLLDIQGPEPEPDPDSCAAAASEIHNPEDHQVSEPLHRTEYKDPSDMN